MEIAFELPLDEDGYLDRECPLCERLFRWHHGPLDQQIDDDSTSPGAYFCPYCGQQAPVDEWWTREQVEAAQRAAAAAVVPKIEEELRDAFKGLNRSRFIKADVEAARPSPAAPLFVEPADLLTVSSPCHPEEPVKIGPQWGSALHCLVCGSEFVI